MFFQNKNMCHFKSKADKLLMRHFPSLLKNKIPFERCKGYMELKFMIYRNQKNSPKNYKSPM